MQSIHNIGIILDKVFGRTRSEFIHAHHDIDLAVILCCQGLFNSSFTFKIRCEDLIYGQRRFTQKISMIL